MSCREGKPESARPKGTDKVRDKLCRPRSIDASTKGIRGGQKPPQTSGCHPGCHLRDPSGARERKRGAAGTAFGDGPPAVILSLGLPCVSGAAASGAWALHLHVACHPCGLPSPLLLPHGLAGVTTRVVCGNTPQRLGRRTSARVFWDLCDSFRQETALSPHTVFPDPVVQDFAKAIVSFVFLLVPGHHFRNVTSRDIPKELSGIKKEIKSVKSLHWALRDTDFPEEEDEVFL